MDGGDSGEDGIELNVYYDSDQSQEDPESELADTGDDAVLEGGLDDCYDCSYCGVSLCTQRFKVKHELRCKDLMQRRELESLVTEVYSCGYCKCPFVSEEYRKQHQQKYCRKRPVAKRRDSNGPYFGCDKCNYVGKRKNDLKRHLLNHDKNNAEWFTCTQCSYKTVHKHTMTRHMKIHSSTSTCCCPICGKSFKTKQCLDKHLLGQHSDEPEKVSTLVTSKIYTCDICNQYRTILKTNLKVHVSITHLKGEGCQKYACPHCPYSTFRKMDLKVHSKAHLEQKGYRCTVCKKQFTQKSHLDSHVLYHHADNVDLMKTITSKIHCCELCSFKTVATTNLKRHVQSKHLIC